MRFRSLLITLLLIAPAWVQAEGPQFIYQKKSLYRNILVMEWEGKRCMQFGRIHAQQTCIHLSEPNTLVLSYTWGLLAGLYAAPNPERVLILGLGGGVTSRAIRTLYPSARIDSVELDPAVVEVAKEYFWYKEDSQSKAYVSDARVFVRKQQRESIQYDLVIIDAFEKDYIPEHLLTNEFLQDVQTLLTPNGVIAANTFAQGQLARHEAATYQSVFSETYVVELDGGNRIILAGNSGLPSFNELSETAASLDDPFAQFGLKPGHLIKRIKEQPQETVYQPLTDQYSPANLLLFQDRG